jgi:hypothetical protein
VKSNSDDCIFMAQTGEYIKGSSVNRSLSKLETRLGKFATYPERLFTSTKIAMGIVVASAILTLLFFNFKIFSR